MASSLPGPSSQADSCSQEHLPARGGFSSWELQNNSFSHLTRSHLLLRLSPECGQEVGALFFHPAPNHGVEACSHLRWGMLRILGPVTFALATSGQTLPVHLRRLDFILHTVENHESALTCVVSMAATSHMWLTEHLKCG